MEKPTSNTIAILMAAGLGTRMRPITLTTPKPLVKVNGVPMIETVINGLLDRGISHIYVVTGYLKEKFSYLEDKYSNLTLVENTEYQVKNNISSIHAIRDVLGTADCFICEADLVVSDPSIFLYDTKKSGYYGKMVKGYTDDWAFTLDNDRIIHVGKGGNDLYNMVGVSFFKKKDATIIKNAIDRAYETPGHEQLYWDEIVDQEIKNLDLCIYEVRKDQIVEIDSVSELAEVDSSYKTYIV